MQILNYVILSINCFLLTILFTCFKVGFNLMDHFFRPPCSLSMPLQIQCDTNVHNLVILEPSFAAVQARQGAQIVLLGVQKNGTNTIATFCREKIEKKFS